MSRKVIHIFRNFLFYLLGGFIAGVIGTLAVLSYMQSAKNQIVEQNNKPEEMNTKIVQDIIKENTHSVVDVVKKVSPAVVSILITKNVSVQTNQFNGDIFDRFFGFGNQPNNQPNNKGKSEEMRVGGGSGFIISKNGLILTNRHVVQDENAKYTVVLSDGREFGADVLGKDPLNDIAILKINIDGDYPFVELGDSDKIEIGQTVVAIGYALGEFQNTVTKGIVSGINRRVIAGNGVSSDTIERAIQTDAAINQGNSGGPLLDENSMVIGINTAVSRQGQLIGFAIPINDAKIVVESVEKHGRIVRPWLGVRYVIVTPELNQANDLGVDFGALIVPGTISDSSVIKNSPAEKAGLKERDIIISINGILINETHSPGDIIAQKQVGDEIVLKILRDKKEMIIKAVLEELNFQLK